MPLLPSCCCPAPCCCCSAHCPGWPPRSWPPAHAQRGALSAAAQEPEGGVGLRLPPLLICQGRAPHQKVRLYRFYFSRGSGLKSPPCLFFPKNFSNQKFSLGTGRRWAGGWFRRTPGRVVRLPPAFPLGCPFAGRGGAVNGPVRRSFIFPGGGLGVLFGVPVSPAGEVLSSPQMPVPDNETKAGIFSGKVIIVDNGSDCRKTLKAAILCPIMTCN